MHHMTLMTIADTPHSIALGSAIGIFFGFTPLYPLKTLLSIAVAWVCRCNKIAAAIAVTLHDVLIWAMPAIYVAEYHLGCWTLNRPAARRIHLRQFGLRDYIDWHVFSRVVWPTFWPAFVGSLFLAIPSAIIIYFVMRLLVSRARMPQKTGGAKVERSPRRLFNALALGAALPPDIFALGDRLASVRAGLAFSGEADPSLTRSRELQRAFANQNASIKVLRFEGSYAFDTSFSYRFFRFSRQHDASALRCCRRGVSHCRRTNGLHFGRTGTEEKTPSRQPDENCDCKCGARLGGTQIGRPQPGSYDPAGGVCRHSRKQHWLSAGR